MHPYEALYFDVSGTLIDEGADFLAHTDLVQEFLTTYKLEGDAHQLCKVYERYLSDIYDRTLAPTCFKTLASLHADALYKLATIDMKDEVRDRLQYNDVERFGPLSNKFHVLHAKLLQGAEAALHAGHKLDMHVGVISDYDDQPLYGMIEKLKLVELLDSITSSEEVKSYKPAKRIFSAALTKAACIASEAIYVGDRWDRDVVGAKNAGMVSVLIGSDSSGNPPPDFLIEDICALPELLSQIRGG